MILPKGWEKSLLNNGYRHTTYGLTVKTKTDIQLFDQLNMAGANLEYVDAEAKAEAFKSGDFDVRGQERVC